MTPAAAPSEVLQRPFPEGSALSFGQHDRKEAGGTGFPVMRQKPPRPVRQGGTNRRRAAPPVAAAALGAHARPGGLGAGAGAVQVGAGRGAAEPRGCRRGPAAALSPAGGAGQPWGRRRRPVM